MPEINVLLQDGLTCTVSMNGFEFNYRDDHWRLSRALVVNVSYLTKFEGVVSEDVRETLVHYAETSSAHHVQNLAKTVQLYLRVTGESNFTEHGLIAFKNALHENELFKLSVLRGFIRQMRYLGLADNFDHSIFELSDKWRLPGNDKGVAVASFDPLEGPFSDLEFEAIGHNAAHRYAEGVINIEEYIVISLFKASGRRPEQLALCKCKDFHYTNQLNGITTLIGNIPRIKQRGYPARSSFRPYAFCKSIAQIIEKYIKEMTLEVESALRRKLTVKECEELPLFPDKNMLLEMQRLPQKQSQEYLSSELSHISSAELSGSLKKAVSKLGIISERTGQSLHVTSYRFRYTLGTRAAQQGAGRLTIATLLDHSDTQNVDVYVQNVPEFAVEISKIMNQSLSRYASAFAGRLVGGEEEANRENKGATRIPCHEKGCDVGSCGSTAFCQDYAPIACYLCPKFRPWAHAQHHLVLEWLMEERERLKLATNNDMQVVVINDRAIVAVCQVIKLVKEYNQNAQ